MNSASWNREGFSESAPRLGCGYEFWDNYFSRCLGWIAESACGTGAGANSGNLIFRYPAHPGPIGCWAGSRNLLVAAVRVRILEIMACDIQPLPNRSFSARPPILARGHHSEDFRSEGHGHGAQSRTCSPHPRAQRPGAAAAALQWASYHISRTFRSLISGPCQMSKGRSPQPGIK